MVLNAGFPSIGRARAVAALVLVALAALLAVAPGGARASVPPPAQDPFYRYTGATPLADIAPGTVLKTRTVPYHVLGLPLPLKAVQLLYRSTGQIGQPTADVTSIVRGVGGSASRRLLSYQSFYDSLSPNDQPSYAIAGGLTLGGAIPAVETPMIAPFLFAGYSVAIPDTEGQTANFAAGPEYGKHTLDGVRAAFASPATGLASDAKVGLFGYSGGAIATEWASELAPSYAPDVDRRLVGAAMGGVLVHPAHNLHYVEGSQVWAGVLPMAVVGIARGFQIDLSQYLNDQGRRIYEKLKDASIINVLGQYPGLTWKQMAKPEYATPESIPIYVETVNKLIMGTGGTPTTPLFVGQAANGDFEGTSSGKPGIGAGDGVMITGDVRSLARQYCAKGVKVEYQQYDVLSHFTAMVMWLPEATNWMMQRFDGRAAPQNCATIKPGNPLDPIAAPAAP